MSLGQPGPLRRTCRRAGLDRNPLRRPEDRMQTALAALLLLAFLASLPLAALLVAVPVYRAEVAAVAAEQARLRPVTATVLTAEPAPLYAPVAGATVRFTGPDGAERTSVHRATGPLTPGAAVTVWLNAAGEPVEPPPPAAPLGRAVLLTAGVLLGALILCGGGYLAGRIALDRRRSRAWDREWAGAPWAGA
ncbi:Rv1733c family protein [Nocardia harenae]|uniref:Rv1733c family protein n=1 Tax=Nocardia harenae TaxID=358707 RepID=UPI000835F511|nr:hypothetical protein [Nocardia harenae]